MGAFFICLIRLEVSKATATVLYWDHWVWWNYSCLFNKLTRTHILIVYIYLRLVLHMKRVFLRFLKKRLSLLRGVLDWVSLISHVRVLYLISSFEGGLLRRVQCNTRLIIAWLSEGVVVWWLESVGILLLYEWVLSGNAIYFRISETLRDLRKTVSVVTLIRDGDWLSQKLVVCRLLLVDTGYILDRCVVRLIGSSYQPLCEIYWDIDHILFALAVLPWRDLLTLDLLLKRNVTCMLATLWLLHLLLHQLILVLLCS